MADPVNVSRATAPGLFCKFDHAQGGRYYYDTSFGEQFFVHYYDVPSTGLRRIMPADEMETFMEHFNEYHTGE